MEEYGIGNEEHPNPDDGEHFGTFWRIKHHYPRHTVEEAGTSAWTPTWVLLVFRLISFAVLLCSLAYWARKGEFTFQYFTVWSLVGAIVAFLAGAVSSLCALSPAPRPAWQNNLASLTVLLMQVFSTAAFLVVPIYWGVIWPGDFVDFPRMIPHGISFLFFVIDFILAGSLKFRLMYIIIYVGYLILYTVFTWVYFDLTTTWPYPILDFRNQPLARVVLWYLVALACGIGSAFIVLTISRICRFLNHDQRIPAAQLYANCQS